MKIVKPGFVLLGSIDGQAILKRLEQVGRICYKSEDKITDKSAKDFVKMLITRNHTAMLEHVSVSIKFITDRGVTHEMVRHRLAAFAQESTRYCNYGNSNGITVIEPCFWQGNTPEDEMKRIHWYKAMQDTEKCYLALLELGASPQEARSVLPNSLKTEIIITANLREWRHILNLRTSEAAHPQMREVMRPLLDMFKECIPVVFDDIQY